MNNGDTWRDYFRNWPGSVAPTGIIVTSFQEQVPFESFQLSDRLLLLNRRAPDTVGARRIVVPFAEIVAVKITDIISAKAVKDLGFEPPNTKQPQAEAAHA
jgi:hypothetical protein